MLCGQRNVCAVAARRSGKSVGVRAKLITKALTTPNGLVGYCAPTLSQAKRLLWTQLMRDVSDPASEHFVASVNHSELYIKFRNGCYLRIYGAERPEQIRGDGFDAFVCDEADDPNYTRTFFDEIVEPALSDQQGQLIQVGSPKGRGRLYREFQKGQSGSKEYDAGSASIQVTAIEAGILRPEEIERARRLRPSRAFRQEYMADFLAPAGLVYDEWNRDVHVVQNDQLPKTGFDEFIVGVDWGTSNRGAMVVIGLDRVWIPPVGSLAAQELARAWVVDERSYAGMGYDDGGWWAVARDIQDKWQPSAWYCDPAGGTDGYIKQLKRALTGSAADRVFPAKNQVRPGISTLRDLMHHSPGDSLGVEDQARFFVLDECEQTIGEIESYRYKAHPRLEDEYLEDPVKESDHLLDGGRYALHTHLEAA